MNRLAAILLCLLSLCAFVACSKQEPGAQKSGSSDHDHDHDHGDDHDHGHGESETTVALGAATIGGWTVGVTRGEGDVKPGGEVAVDLQLTDGAGTIDAVRIWIGAADGAGSIKELAKPEEGGGANHYHGHAEAPSPLPAGSKLWIELEIKGQAKQAGSVPLNPS
jgi:hypothetical protein